MWCIGHFPKSNRWFMEPIIDYEPKFNVVESWFDYTYNEIGYEVQVGYTYEVVAFRVGKKLILEALKHY